MDYLVCAAISSLLYTQLLHLAPATSLLTHSQARKCTGTEEVPLLGFSPSNLAEAEATEEVLIRNECAGVRYV